MNTKIQQTDNHDNQINQLTQYRWQHNMETSYLKQSSVLLMYSNGVDSHILNYNCCSFWQDRNCGTNSNAYRSGFFSGHGRSWLWIYVAGGVRVCLCDWCVTSKVVERWKTLWALDVESIPLLHCARCTTHSPAHSCKMTHCPFPLNECSCRCFIKSFRGTSTELHFQLVLEPSLQSGLGQSTYACARELALS